jgi:hypothetical protein
MVTMQRATLASDAKRAVIIIPMSPSLPVVLIVRGMLRVPPPRMFKCLSAAIVQAHDVSIAT